VHAVLSLSRPCFPNRFQLFYKSVAIMASIPLHCNVCPREPQFSDISHLLTHVASKGHLSHYFKSQVRARQDQNIRNKIDIYDQWYEKYGIEKLLSLRMTSKESKDTTGRKTCTTNKTASAKSARATKPRTRRTKAPPREEQSPSPVKSEEPIDPQLSQYYLPSFGQSPFDLATPDAAAQHRAYVPRMVEDHNDTGDLPLRFSSEVPYNRRAITRPSPDLSRDSEGDYFRAFLRSPTRTAYPDPSELTGITSQLLAPEEDGDSENEVLGPSPILKGVKWPGMSLFDSASIQAQRLRNQKKDGSILQQMEQDSAAVEPMEHIYWPEGTLKKKRLITGNVESSPVRAPTPPPKRRQNKPRKALTAMSTNNPRIPQKRGRKPRQQIGSDGSEVQEVSKKALANTTTVYPRNAHTAYEPANDSEVERKLNRGRRNGGRKPAFAVFNDAKEKSERPSRSYLGDITNSPLLHRRPPHDSPLAHYNSITAHRNAPLLANPFGTRTDGENPKAPKDLQLRSRFRPPQQAQFEEETENIEPVKHHHGGVDGEGVSAVEERATQRYFSITGNQPAQFFSNMPPQMDFGGGAGPVFHGSAINPLSDYLHRHRLRPDHLPTYFLHHGLPSLSTESHDRQEAVSTPSLHDGKNQHAKRARP